MDTRYQVFISSTFTDLKDERQAVLRAVLELDHMPAGMELFPAADDSAWQLIRDVIDSSDYYVVIIGGRYGSLDESGLGYTEKEYDYAFQAKKPVIPLLHENPDNLPRERTETDEAVWAKLQAFRAKVERQHTCAYWKSAEELKARVIVGLTTAVKRHPATGWIRSDQVPAEATLAEVLALRNRVAELEAEAEATRLTPPAGTEELQHGDDKFPFHVAFTARNPGEFSGGHRYNIAVNQTWNELFAAVAPTMINEASDEELRSAFRSFIQQRVYQDFGGQRELKGKELHNFGYSNQAIETCIIQFRALGLIKESIRNRSIRDTKTYWRLTPYGDHLMTQLRAIRRKPLETEEPDGGALEKDAFRKGTGS